MRGGCIEQRLIIIADVVDSWVGWGMIAKLALSLVSSKCMPRPISRVFHKSGIGCWSVSDSG